MINKKKDFVTFNCVGIPTIIPRNNIAGMDYKENKSGLVKLRFYLINRLFIPSEGECTSLFIETNKTFAQEYIDWFINYKPTLWDKLKAIFDKGAL